MAIAADVRDVIEERRWGLPLRGTEDEEEDARDCTGEVDGDPDGETAAEFRFSFLARVVVVVVVVFREALGVAVMEVIPIVSSSCWCCCWCCWCWWETPDEKAMDEGPGGEGGANEFSMRKLQSS